MTASPSSVQLHAIMDEVDRLRARADQDTAPSEKEVVQQVLRTYQDLGLKADLDLVTQAVRSRSMATSASLAVQPDPRPYDFGWKRPTNLAAWENRVRQHQDWTQRLQAGLGIASSVAFFVWLGMFLGWTPQWMNYPWLFAIGCMGSGSLIESYIAYRRRRIRPMEPAARTPSAKMVRNWQTHPRCRAYLEALLSQDVPLLRGDVDRLKALAQQERQLTPLRQGLVG